ncbi:hypothetical protein ABZV60_26395 [Streptomyces sp. NPDC004787]|uniref:hypothetical protein n=1 Tax=Streptomyces sp. NPDC004787 TaxID=3154291 RepID=UPI0033A2CAE7
MTDVNGFAKGGKFIEMLRVFFGNGLAATVDGDVHMKHRRLMQPMFNKAHLTARGELRSVIDGWDGGATGAFART